MNYKDYYSQYQVIMDYCKEGKYFNSKQLQMYYNNYYKLFEDEEVQKAWKDITIIDVKPEPELKTLNLRNYL